MATFFVRIDTYWAGSHDRFVGPFNSRQDANAAINAAVWAEGSLVTPSGKMAKNAKSGIRVHGIVSKSEAKRLGFKGNALTEIPLDTEALYQAEQEEVPA